MAGVWFFGRVAGVAAIAAGTTFVAWKASVLAQAPPSPPPPAEELVRPPADNASTMRPLSANEIPPNLSFYAIDPLYKAGAPLGWATTRLEETLDRGLDVRPLDGGRVYLSWRLLKADAARVRFDVYRET